MTITTKTVLPCHAIVRAGVEPSTQRVFLVDREGAEVDISRWCLKAVVSVDPRDPTTVELTMFCRTGDPE